MRLHATGAYDNQGVAFTLAIAATATARVEDEVWTAAATRIGHLRTWFDGTRGAQQTTFGQDETWTDLAKARREAALHPQLELQQLYATVAIAGKTRLDDDEVLVVALGTDTKLYVSARTGLIVRRDRGAEQTRFGDFRSVDGEVVPFHWVTTDALGEKTTRVDRVDFNVAIPATTFAPAKL
jgi:hypothetical protein